MSLSDMLRGAMEEAKSQKGGDQDGQHDAPADAIDDGAEAGRSAAADDAQSGSDGQDSAATESQDAAGSAGHDGARRSTVLRDRLKKSQLLGESADDLTDEDLFPHIENLIRSQQQLSEQSEQLRQRAQQYDSELAEFRTDKDAYEAWKQQSKAKPAQQEPAAGDSAGQTQKKVGKWAAPEYDPEWRSAVEVDPETGMYRGKQKYSDWGIVAARKLNDYERHIKEMGRKLVSDPLGAVRDAGLEDYLEAKLQDIRKQLDDTKSELSKQWESRSSAVREEDKIEDFLRQNAKLFVEYDGEFPKIDPITNRPSFTRFGQQYMASTETAEKMLGVSDKVKIHAYALREAQRLAGAKPNGKAPAEAAKNGKPAAKPVDKKEAFLSRAKKPAEGDSSREGGRVARAAAGRPANEELSFKDMVLRDPDNADVLGGEYKG